MDHYLNISLLELYDIVCQIHIEKESDVWFGRFSQWLAQLAELPRQPFGLVWFSAYVVSRQVGVSLSAQRIIEFVRISACEEHDQHVQHLFSTSTDMCSGHVQSTVLP